MKYLKFIFQFSIAAIIILSSFSAKSEPILQGLIANKAVVVKVMEENFTYVRVLIDGIWWIYVYDSEW